eukprot:Pgem_evm2s17674
MSNLKLDYPTPLPYKQPNPNLMLFSPTSSEPQQTEQTTEPESGPATEPTAEASLEEKITPEREEKE